MVEYSILKPPPRRRRRVVITVGLVVLVAAVALGAFAIGKHARPGGPVAQAGGAGTTAPPAVKALTVVSTSPAAG